MASEKNDCDVERAFHALRSVGRVRTHQSGNAFVELDHDGVTDDVPREHAADFQALPAFSLDLCRSAVTDDGLQHLAGANGLNSITFTGRSEITGAGFRYLARLPLLESLYLDASGVTEEGLAGIGRVTSLRTLWLRLNYIGDDGLWHLSNLVHLERLALESRLVSDEGLQHLGLLTNLRQLHT